MVAAGTTFKAIGSAIDMRALASQNLFFVFVYNIMRIPVAAGALYAVPGLLLNPMIAAAAMALSPLSVVANANPASPVQSRDLPAEGETADHRNVEDYEHEGQEECRWRRCRTPCAGWRSTRPRPRRARSTRARPNAVVLGNWLFVMKRGALC
jgi:hypothetical protein